MRHKTATLTSHLAPRTSHLAPLTSHLAPLTSHLSPSPLTSHPHPSPLTRTPHLSPAPLTSHTSPQVRLKDRNPAPLQNLELLFEGTYQQLLGLSDATENAQSQLKFHSTRLAAGTRLLLLLFKLRSELSAEAHLAAHPRCSPSLLTLTPTPTQV